MHLEQAIPESLATQQGLMRAITISGLAWFTLVFLGIAFVVHPQEFNSKWLTSDAHQAVQDNRIAQNTESIAALRSEIKENRVITQQVQGDIATFKGIVMGFGGLFAFLQFVSILMQMNVIKRTHP